MGLLGFGKDRTFFHLPESQAGIALQAADLLRDLLADLGKAGDLAVRIGELEAQADKVVHDLNRRVDGAFITPLDKEDLHALSGSLDDVVDAIDDAAACVVMYRLTEPRSDLAPLAEKLVRAVTAVRDGVALVKFNPAREDLASILTALHTLEDEADQMYRQSVAVLFDEAGRDALYVVKWKDVYDWMESVFDSCERVADVLETIAVKYA